MPSIVPLIKKHLVLLVLILFCSCATSPPELTLVIAPQGLHPEIAKALEKLLWEEGKIRLKIIEGKGSVSNLALLQEGRADLTFVENSARYHQQVRTVLPMYPGVLHVLHRRTDAPKNVFELIKGKKIYVGAKGGMAEWLLKLTLNQVGILGSDYTIVEDFESSDPDVIVVFGMINPEVGNRIGDRYTFYSIGEVEDLGKGAVVEGLAIKYPQLQPFIIPRHTYEKLNDKPILTLSVDTLLVARRGLPDELVYDLARTVLENRQEFGKINASLFRGISEQINFAALNFPMHPGARDYLERNEPTLFERYAESIGVLFSVFVASVSALIAFWRWRLQRKKDRIDIFYTKLIAVRKTIEDFDSGEQCSAAAERVKALQNEAFELLINEKVSADESFRIFITLSKDIEGEIEKRREELLV